MSAACQLILEYMNQESRLYGERFSSQRLMHLFCDVRKYYTDNHRIVVPGNDYQVVFLAWYDTHITELAPLVCDISPTDATSVQHNYTAWLHTTR